MEVVQLGGHLWGIQSPRYSPALHALAKSTPGMVWNAEHRAWVGWPDAVRLCARRLLKKGIEVTGELPTRGALVKECNIAPEHLDGLREYQKEGVEFITSLAHTGVLLADDLGLGKTSQAIRAIGALKHDAIVVCPSFVRGVWTREIAKWLPKTNVIELDGVTLRCSNCKGTGDDARCDRVKCLRCDGTGKIQTLSAGFKSQTVFMVHYDIVYAWERLLRKSGAQTIVFDECFPAGTNVSTPTGPKPIESIRTGDAVECAVGTGCVQNIGCREAPLVALRIVQLDDGREFICTIDHPILALRPHSEMPYWCAAGNLLPGSFILDVMHTRAVHNWDEQRRVSTQVPRAKEGEEAMQALFAGRTDEARSLLLLSLLRGEMASSAAGTESAPAQDSSEPGVSSEVVAWAKSSARAKTRMGEGEQSSNETAESDALSGSTCESETHKTYARIQKPPIAEPWWKRAVDAVTRKDVDTSLWVTVAADSGTNGPWCAPQEATDELQDRFGARGEEDRGGGGWCEPLWAKGAGSAQRSLPPLARVARVAIPEPADFTRLGLGGPNDQGRVQVYNLEVDKHPSYVVAGGVVAHNCHYLQSDKSRRSVSCRNLSIPMKYRIGLSGTPMTNRPSDLWNPLNTLCPWRFGKPFDFFVRYSNAHQETITMRDGPKTIWNTTGASHMKELNRRLRWFMLRRTKTDVKMELPPRIRQNIELEVPRSFTGYSKGLKADKAIRAALALAADGKLPKAIELVASHVTDKRKIVVFSHRVAVAKMIAAALQKQKIDARPATGEETRKQRQRLIDEKHDVLCATMDAMPVGVDLSYADVVVYVELDYVPSKILQTEGRVFRFGQKKSVLVQYVIALGTLDECIRDQVLAKLENFEKIIGNVDDNLQGDLGGEVLDTKAQLKSLTSKIMKQAEELELKRKEARRKKAA